MITEQWEVVKAGNPDPAAAAQLRVIPSCCNKGEGEFALRRQRLQQKLILSSTDFPPRDL